MNARERGFLLLTSHLGGPERRVLTPAQLRVLSQRVREMALPREDRDLHGADLQALGYDEAMSARMLDLLSEEKRLDTYLSWAASYGCTPVTRVSEHYPALLRRRLGLDSPGTLWALGDLDILNTPAIALVGSRDLREENRVFAQAVGRAAAYRGLTLVSGNARGADRTAQESCLAAGGRVISVVADELCRRSPRRGVLYLSEEDFDAPFSAQRALSRNRCIHALGQAVFVAQSDLGQGGTWDGTVKNLRFGWSRVACFRDGSPAAGKLSDMGASLVDIADLENLETWLEPEIRLF